MQILLCFLAFAVVTLYVQAVLLSEYDFAFTNQTIKVNENIYFKNLSVTVGKEGKHKRLAVNMTLDLLATVGDELSMGISIDEIIAGGSLQNLFTLSFDACHSLEKDKFVMPWIRRSSNLPLKCPIKPFTYQMTNLILCEKPPFPPMMPELPFILTYEFFYTGARKRFAYFQIEMKVIPF